MKFGKMVLRILSVVFLAGVFFTNSASALEPQVQVLNGSTQYDVLLTDTTASPDILNHIDWATLRFEFNGIDLTGAVLGLIGTPFLQIPALSTSSVTIRIVANLTFLAGRVSVCYIPAQGGGCGMNQTVLREPLTSACSSYPACIEQAPMMGSYKTGGTWNPSAFPITLSAPTVINKLIVVGGVAVGNPTWTSTWTLNVWTTAQAFANSGLVGNVVNNAPLSITHVPIGNPAYRNHEVTMTPTAPSGVFLPAGTYYMGVLVDGEAFGIRETVTNLQTDIVTNDVNIGTYFMYNPTLSYNPGSEFSRVIGY